MLAEALCPLSAAHLELTGTERGLVVVLHIRRSLHPWSLTHRHLGPALRLVTSRLCYSLQQRDAAGWQWRRHGDVAIWLHRWDDHRSESDCDSHRNYITNTTQSKESGTVTRPHPGCWTAAWYRLFTALSTALLSLSLSLNSVQFNAIQFNKLYWHYCVLQYWFLCCISFKHGKNVLFLSNFFLLQQAFKEDKTKLWEKNFNLWKALVVS